jgi:hypothetical protein
MKKILYYPYIDIPDNLWTTNSLLYWDEIGTIHPLAANIARKSSFTEELINSGFLKKVNPDSFDFDRYRFHQRLFDFISSEEYKIEVTI